MKLSLALGIVLIGFRAFAQTITGASIDPTGWYMSVWISGLGTNGTYNFGLGANNLVSASCRVVLKSTDASVDQNGTADTFTRYIVGTQRIRLPYPTFTTPDEALENGGVKIKIALSEFIYTNRTVTLTTLAGFYAQGGSNAPAASGITVTNLSTRVYQKPFAQWTMVPFQIATQTTATLKLFAVGHGAADAAAQGFRGRPVRWVKFWATDDAGNKTATNTVLAPIVGSGYAGDSGGTNDARPVIEFCTQLPLAGVSNNAVLTAHAAVMPWIGDTNAITYDSTSGYSFPHTEFVETKFFSDTNNNFAGRWVAVIATNGVDANGVLATVSSFNSGSPPTAFLTPAGAFNRMVLSNTTHNGRSDAAGGFIYAQAGSYNLGGATTSSNNIPGTWVTMMPFPGVDRSSVVFTNSANSRNIGHMARFKDLTIEAVGSSGWLGGNLGYAWFDGCRFTTNVTDARVINTVTNWYVTGCKIDKLPQGIAPYTSNDSTPLLVRGNDFSDWTQTTGAAIFKGTVIGNYRGGSANTNGLLQFSRGTWQNKMDSHPLIAFNEMRTLRVVNADTIQLNNPGDGYQCTNGAALVQNYIENAGNSANGGRIMSNASSVQGTDDSNNPVNNVFLWNNTFAGQRLNLGENAGGLTNSAVSADRLYWSVLNNYMTQPNTKHDDKYNPNGVRIGGWPVSYGVGWSGNTDPDPQAIDSAWRWDFFGVNSFVTNTWSGSGPTAAWVLWPRFLNVGFQTADGNYGTGNGDPRLGAGSGLQKVRSAQVLPFDLYGKGRTPIDPVGAVSIGNQRRGQGIVE